METILRKNITLPKYLVRAIDEYAQNRSGFLAQAAAEKLAREKAVGTILKSAGIFKGKLKGGRSFVRALRKEETRRLKRLYG